MLCYNVSRLVLSDYNLSGARPVNRLPAIAGQLVGTEYYDLSRGATYRVGVKNSALTQAVLEDSDMIATLSSETVTYLVPHRDEPPTPDSGILLYLRTDAAEDSLGDLTFQTKTDAGVVADVDVGDVILRASADTIHLIGPWDNLGSPVEEVGDDAADVTSREALLRLLQTDADPGHGHQGQH